MIAYSFVVVFSVHVFVVIAIVVSRMPGRTEWNDRSWQDDTAAGPLSGAAASSAATQDPSKRMRNNIVRNVRSKIESARVDCLVTLGCIHCRIEKSVWYLGAFRMALAQLVRG